MSYPGGPGIATALVVFLAIWLMAYLKNEGKSYEFDPVGSPGEFGKTLLPMYLDIAKFIMGLGSGSIVLLAGSANFSQTATRPLKSFASPLFLVAASIVYGVFFMIFIVSDYEHHRHHPDSHSYTRFRYTRNITLGFAALVCFCVGYVWFVADTLT